VITNGSPCPAARSFRPWFDVRDEERLHGQGAGEAPRQIRGGLRGQLAARTSSARALNGLTLHFTSPSRSLPLACDSLKAVDVARAGKGHSPPAATGPCPMLGAADLGAQVPAGPWSRAAQVARKGSVHGRGRLAELVLQVTDPS
jgi:hypothetical protein